MTIGGENKKLQEEKTYIYISEIETKTHGCFSGGNLSILIDSLCYEANIVNKKWFLCGKKNKGGLQWFSNGFLLAG